MSNRRSKNVKVTNPEDVDRLGRLPDFLLGHILSLLPTRNAVRTSLLSINWRYKWTLITKLDLDDRLLAHSPKRKLNSGKKMFVNFVERVLVLLGNSTIQEFKLRCWNDDYDPNHISTWILAAMRHDARKIEINCTLEKSVAFPCLMYCCAAVEELKLEMNCSIKVGAPVTFSSLRIMNLDGVIFLHKSASAFEFHFSVLEVMNLVNCLWEKGTSIHINAPNLARLTIRDDLIPDLINSQSTCYCFLQMCAPRLATFECHGFSVPHVYQTGSTAIMDLFAEVSSYAHKDSLHDRMVKLLKAFSSAKNLKISSNSLESDLPRMYNLTNINIVDGKIDESLMALLLSAPVLESLIFGKSFKYDKNADLEGMVPKFLLSQLKVVQFDVWCNWNGDWIELARFFLSTAVVLEKMIIKSHGSIPTKQMEQLLECPRCSSRASIVFGR